MPQNEEPRKPNDDPKHNEPHGGPGHDGPHGHHEHSEDCGCHEHHHAPIGPREVKLECIRQATELVIAFASKLGSGKLSAEELAKYVVTVAREAERFISKPE